MPIVVGLIEHMGDIVACEPVSRYLKINNPGVRLAWAVSTPYRELIDTNPHIDETILIDCLTDWIKLTKHGSYDQIIDLHVNGRICQHCRIPLVKEQGNPFINVSEWFDYGSLLEAFSAGAGLPRLSAQPCVYLEEQHGRTVDRLNLPDNFCVVHTTSLTESKHWTRTKWEELCRWIAQGLHLHVVEVGAGKANYPLPLPQGGVSLVDKLSILQTAEVIRRAELFIGIDSGPAHLANALQRPSVILLGPLAYFNQYMPFSGFFTKHDPQVKIVRSLKRRVADLTVDEVKEAVNYVAKATVDASLNMSLERLAVKGAAISHAACKAPSPHERAQVLASGLFDPGWYAIHCPCAISKADDLVGHYFTVGAAEGASPSAKFDSGLYLKANPDVARAGVNPLLHFVQRGQDEGRQVLSAPPPPDGSAWVREEAGSGSFGEAAPLLSEVMGTTNVLGPLEQPAGRNGHPRIFAFYLPQFHPIPENDWAHGPGFGEWNNVIKAKPLFRGHYQPRIPGELGFYDLRSPEVLDSQVDLARQNGVTGFCFYYYYFQGKRLLYKPIQNYIQSSCNAPFCLLWANENWTKRWDGGGSEVIIQQQHSHEDDLAFIRQLLPIFEDERYVTVEGKPVLLIYKSHLFPDIGRATDIWREAATARGFPGLYLVMADDWLPDLDHPREQGFDASYEIPSNLLPQQVLSSDRDSLDLPENFTGQIVDYAKFASFHMGRPFPDYKRFRTVMLPWDNTPRYGTSAIVHINGEGDAYRLWLTQALLESYRRYPADERIVFIHSWNEWCEGTYLEPDGRYGRKFLQQTSEAVETITTAIELAAQTPSAVPLMSQLLNVMRKKDEGAYRVMKAARTQTLYISRELREELARLNAERDMLLTKLNLIEKSTSWKALAPLRTVVDWIRGNH
jgi:ADP-heptose:LPS heptosyltransferase